jgi:hypothetical protein
LVLNGRAEMRVVFDAVSGDQSDRFDRSLRHLMRRGAVHRNDDRHASLR